MGQDCNSGKYRYRDKLGAQIALAKISHDDKPFRFKSEKRAYHCPLCRGWHLTSQRRRSA